MLKRKILKRIFIFISVFIIIAIISIFPQKDNYLLVTNNLNNYHDIYLLDNENYIIKTKVNLINTSIDEQIKEIISIMTIGSKESKKINKNFKPIIPKNTVIKEVKILNNEAILDFNNNILNIQNEYEDKLLEALVFSITSLKNINSISIMVNGKILDSLPNSNKKISYPLDRSIKINKEYNISKIINTNVITVFYNAIDNNTKYYIPVTKYMNNNKEKIEIIIEELKSSTTNNINLVNYLNKEVELASYNILDNSVILNLTSTFSDLNNENISEEIISAVKDSIKETYNVENVICFINNQIIN